MNNNVEPSVLLDETDLDPRVRRDLAARAKGGRALGGGVRSAGENNESDVRQIIANELPSAIANKIKKMIPDGFELKEVELSIKLGGTVFGVGVDGIAKVKFGPRSEVKSG